MSMQHVALIAKLLWRTRDCCAKVQAAVNYRDWGVEAGMDQGWSPVHQAAALSTLGTQSVTQPCLLNIWKHQPAACVIKANPKVHRALVTLTQACWEIELHSVICCLCFLSNSDTSAHTEGRQVAAPILSTFKLHQQVFPLFLKKKKISCIYKASNHNSSGDKTSCRSETSEEDEETEKRGKKSIRRLQIGQSTNYKKAKTKYLSTQLHMLHMMTRPHI